MRGAGGAENRRVTLEEAPTPLCCNPLHPARPRNPTREGGVSLFIRDWSFTTTKKGMLGHAVVSREQVSHVFCCFCFFFFFKEDTKNKPKPNKNQTNPKPKERQKQTKKNPNQMWLEGGGREEDTVQEMKQTKHRCVSVCKRQGCSASLSETV